MARRPVVLELEALQQLKSRRLRLRPAAMTDADAVFAYASDPRVCRFLAWPRHGEIAESRAFLQSAEQGWQSGSRLSWVLECDTGVVGMIGAEIGRAGAGIGYVVAHDAWGRGYASEALGRVSEALFAASSLHSLWAFCHPGNGVSARVLEKCAFRREGRLSRYFTCPNLDGEKHDVLLYVRHRSRGR